MDALAIIIGIAFIIAIVAGVSQRTPRTATANLSPYRKIEFYHFQPLPIGGSIFDFPLYEKRASFTIRAKEIEFTVLGKPTDVFDIIKTTPMDKDMYKIQGVGRSSGLLVDFAISTTNDMVVIHIFGSNEKLAYYPNIPKSLLHKHN